MTTAETIQPALTAEQWTEARDDNVWLPDFGKRNECYAHLDDNGLRISGGDIDGNIDVAESRHALAALCLRGERFGFTREDVAALEGAVVELVSNEDGRSWDERSVAPLRVVIAKINALLPPS